MTHSSVQTGDIIEWLGVPVLVIEPPSEWDKAHQNWQGGAAYLRQPAGHDHRNIVVGKIMPHFTLAGKYHWAGELTDEEWAMAAKLLLIGSI